MDPILASVNTAITKLRTKIEELETEKELEADQIKLLGLESSPFLKYKRYEIINVLEKSLNDKQIKELLDYLQLSKVC